MTRSWAFAEGWSWATPRVVSASKLASSIGSLCFIGGRSLRTRFPVDWEEFTPGEVGLGYSGTLNKKPRQNSHGKDTLVGCRNRSMDIIAHALWTTAAAKTAGRRLRPPLNVGWTV